MSIGYPRNENNLLNHDDHSLRVRYLLLTKLNELNFKKIDDSNHSSHRQNIEYSSST